MCKLTVTCYSSGYFSLTTPVSHPAQPGFVKFSTFFIRASSNTFLGFDNGIFVVFQGDGNFVAYNPGGVAVAATESNSVGSNLELGFQPDGNLVVYSNGIALWASNTAPQAKGGNFVIQDKSPYMTRSDRMVT